jgi:hypothetical protein
MGKRIAPLDEPFDAPLPVGKLEPISSMALSGRWGAVESEADKMDKFPKPADETYRLYLIALAKEAQAYDLTREANERDLGKRTDISPAQADAEFHRAQKFLDEASALYKQIITANSSEKRFREGDTRTEAALQIYAVIERYKSENTVAKTSASGPVAASDTNRSSSPAPSAAPQTDPLSQVLDFCSGGLAPDSIKEYIDSADFLADVRSTGYKFDFKKDPLRLHNACKDNAAPLQSEILKRLSPPKPPGKPASTGQ